MRSTILHHTVRFGVASLVAMGLVAAAETAQAASTCSSNSLDCSTGTAALKVESKDKLVTSLDTGWIPSCGAGVDHCNAKPIQVRADLSIDPVKGTDALYSIDMPQGAIVDATWDKQFITLTTASGATTDGTFKVQHSITPNVQFYVGAFGLSYTYNLDATQLLNKIPGASFNYNAQGIAKFDPWGFNGAQLTVAAPALDASRLFQVDLHVLPAIDQYIDGDLSINAVTRPTFAYKTTKVTLLGTDAPITAAGGSARLATQDGDFIDLPANVEGEISAKGEMEVLPYVHLTRIGDHDNLDMSLGVNVGLKTGYTIAPKKVVFAQQNIHIPLPNVHAPKTLDMGTVKQGAEISKTVAVDNSGELGASLTFTSSNPDFSVPMGGVTTAPKSKYDLKVKFRPSSDGPASATITVKSNDPDSPEQTFMVTANGAVDPNHPQGEDGTDGAGAGGANGCGCKVAAPSGGGFAGFGVLALTGLAAVIRRRRRAS